MSLWKRGDADPYSGLARAEQLTSDTTRAGVVDDGNIAWPERIEQARMQWQQANARDFEQTGRRRYVDRATGTEYRAVPGAVLSSIGTESVRGVSLFFVNGEGRLVFLKPASIPEALVVAHGQVSARQLTSTMPDDSLRVH